MIIGVSMLALAVVLGVIGQMFLRISTTTDMPGLFGISMANLPFLGAAALYFVSLVFYTLSLRYVPLHIAFPSVSVSYVAVAWLSSLFWNTPFGLREIVAFVFILLGLCILVLSQAKTV